MKKKLKTMLEHYHTKRGLMASQFFFKIDMVVIVGTRHTVPSLSHKNTHISSS